jgi:hypothetical protein
VIGQSIFAFAVTTAAAASAAASVPISMQGTWGKHGRCDLLRERLTITRDTAGWGKGPFRRVQYDPQSDAISWSEEGIVDDFVIGRTPNVLIHETQGPSMPGEEGYTRCDRKLKRRPWPPSH